MSKYSYFNDKAVPAIQKVASNSYVVGVQKAVLKVVPMILVSSIITLYNIVKTYVSWLPALDPISNYSFGLIGIMTAFLIPYYLLEEKHDSRKIVGGMTGLAVFMLAMNPKILEGGQSLQFLKLRCSWYVCCNTMRIVYCDDFPFVKSIESGKRGLTTSGFL
ncbi:MAG: hypothetical protein ACLTJG_06255 [[Clostridium] innocuum]